MTEQEMLNQAKAVARRSFRAQQADRRLGHALNATEAVSKGLLKARNVLEREVATKAALEQALEAVDALLRTLKEQEAGEVRKSAERRPVRKSAGGCRCGGAHGEPDWGSYFGCVDLETGELRIECR